MEKITGYMEKAVALYQAMIELHLFCPSAYALTPFDQKLDVFELFWEKDLPRFGQQGAPGWSKTLFMDSGSIEFYEPVVPDFEQDDKNDSYTNWLKKERHGDFFYWMPQLLVDESLEDPFRTVLFDDLRPFLFDLKEKESKPFLVQEFMRFLGLPLEGEMKELDRVLYTFFDEKHDKAFGFPLESGCGTLGAVQVDPYWFPSVSSDTVNYINISGAYKKEFLETIFDQLQSLDEFSTEFLVSSWVLGSCLEKDQKVSHKKAKKLLKTERENVLLWNAFAHFEWSQGRVDEVGHSLEKGLLCKTKRRSK
jgi:hypothetical protein